jgi:hypothetical protein
MSLTTIPDAIHTRATINGRTRPLITSLPDGTYDILDASGRVFWKDMNASTTVDAINDLGGPTFYRAVPATGLPHGAKA